MSLDAMRWAKTVPVADATRRLVLLTLADYADAEWSTFVGQQRLADECLVSKRTAQRILAEFEERGLISREERRRPDGYRTSDRTVIHPDAGSQATPCHVTPATGSGDTGDDLRRQPGQSQVTPGVHAEPSVEPEVEPPVETSSLSADVDALCSQLADKVAAQRGGAQPPVTERWRKDMRLLLERGPLHQDRPEPCSPEKVETTIAYVFAEMSEPEGRSGFCWADQIRSPGALRDHWLQMAQAAKARRRAKLSPVDRAIARTEIATATPDLFSTMLAQLPRPNSAASAAARAALS
jgi:hypothetical protein